MKTLQQIWEELPIRSDKGDVHSYLPVYEKLLAPYRGRDINILEIGLFNGASLVMWDKYFTGQVFGVDCSETPLDGMADLRPMIASGLYNIWIFNAEDPKEIEKWFKGIKFDVVIEDAGHHVEQQVLIYQNMKPYLNKGAIYIVEDVQDLDKTRHLFWPHGEIIDLRHVKKRYDDVLIVIRND